MSNKSVQEKQSRKAVKKLREIETLKQITNRSAEEEAKIQKEPMWRMVIASAADEPKNVNTKGMKRKLRAKTMQHKADLEDMRLAMKKEHMAEITAIVKREKERYMDVVTMHKNKCEALVMENILLQRLLQIEKEKKNNIIRMLQKKHDALQMEYNLLKQSNKKKIFHIHTVGNSCVL